MVYPVLTQSIICINESEEIKDQFSEENVNIPLLSKTHFQDNIIYKDNILGFLLWAKISSARLNRESFAYVTISDFTKFHNRLAQTQYKVDKFKSTFRVLESNNKIKRDNRRYIISEDLYQWAKNPNTKKIDLIRYFCLLPIYLCKSTFFLKKAVEIFDEDPVKSFVYKLISERIIINSLDTCQICGQFEEPRDDDYLILSYNSKKILANIHKKLVDEYILPLSELDLGNLEGKPVSSSKELDEYLNNANIKESIEKLIKILEGLKKKNEKSSKFSEGNDVKRYIWNKILRKRGSVPLKTTNGLERLKLQ